MVNWKLVKLAIAAAAPPRPAPGLVEALASVGCVVDVSTLGEAVGVPAGD
jgi:hypothetical protein